MIFDLIDKKKSRRSRFQISVKNSHSQLYGETSQKITIREYNPIDSYYIYNRKIPYLLVDTNQIFRKFNNQLHPPFYNIKQMNTNIKVYIFYTTAVEFKVFHYTRHFLKFIKLNVRVFTIDNNHLIFFFWRLTNYNTILFQTYQ